MNYIGWDVHAYTPFLSNIITDLQIGNSETSNDDYNTVMDGLQNRYGTDILTCLNNIRELYFKNDKIVDPDLGDYNIFHILVRLYNWNNDLLKETLIEVGGTCLQGLTHRLLLLYLCYLEYNK